MTRVWCSTSRKVTGAPSEFRRVNAAGDEFSSEERRIVGAGAVREMAPMLTKKNQRALLLFLFVCGAMVSIVFVSNRRSRPVASSDYWNSSIFSKSAWESSQRKTARHSMVFDFLRHGLRLGDSSDDIEKLLGKPDSVVAEPFVEWSYIVGRVEESDIKLCIEFESGHVACASTDNFEMFVVNGQYRRVEAAIAVGRKWLEFVGEVGSPSGWEMRDGRLIAYFMGEKTGWLGWHTQMRFVVEINGDVISDFKKWDVFH